MKEQTLGSTRIGCPRTKLTDKAKLSQIVHQFYTIWLKSNESKDYSVSLYKALNGIVSPTNAARLRNEGVARKMFVKTTNGKIRFRAGIAQPNEKMILSLIEESRNQVAEPKPILVSSFLRVFSILAKEPEQTIIKFLVLYFIGFESCLTLKLTSDPGSKTASNSL